MGPYGPMLSANALAHVDGPDVGTLGSWALGLGDLEVF
jgi:hypothetical protein